MKTVVALFLMCGSLMGQGEKTFEVSKANASAANKAQFLKLWEALGKPRFREGVEYKQFLIRQAVGQVGEMHRYLTRNEAVILRDGYLHENSVARAWVNPAGVYDFETVGAGVRRVPQYEEAVAQIDENAPTKEEFVARLKEGTKYTVRILAEKSCRECFGNGNKNAMNGGRVCMECHGTGDALETWILKW